MILPVPTVFGQSCNHVHNLCILLPSFHLPCTLAMLAIHRFLLPSFPLCFNNPSHSSVMHVSQSMRFIRYMSCHFAYQRKMSWNLWMQRRKQQHPRLFCASLTAAPE